MQTVKLIAMLQLLTIKLYQATGLGRCFHSKSQPHPWRLQLPNRSWGTTTWERPGGAPWWWGSLGWRPLDTARVSHTELDTFSGPKVVVRYFYVYLLGPQKPCVLTHLLYLIIVALNGWKKNPSLLPATGIAQQDCVVWTHRTCEQKKDPSRLTYSKTT